jgi:hypothetical protein
LIHSFPPEKAHDGIGNDERFTRRGPNPHQPGLPFVSLKKVQSPAESCSLQGALEGTVKSCQAAGVVMGQGGKVEVGHLLASNQSGPADNVQVCQQRDVIGPENMPSLPGER